MVYIIYDSGTTGDWVIKANEDYSCFKDNQEVK